MNRCKVNQSSVGFSAFLIVLIILISMCTKAFAQPVSGYQLKLVFPFNAEGKNISVCPMQYRTNNGCCDNPSDDVYQINSTTKGCCRAPDRLEAYGEKKQCCPEAFCQGGTIYGKHLDNVCGSCCAPPSEYLAVGTSSSCCAKLSDGQNRWGQTTSSVCGGYCPPTQEVRTHGTFNSCCDTCTEVLAFQTKSSVCGTCCSRIPESCGNAGIRVCSPGTGSAYCSKLPDKCTDADDWLIGSYGEGGYTCCDKCINGKRYNQTNSNCGNCCTNPSVTVSYGGITSCCVSLTQRYDQTTANVCGVSCPANFMASYNGYSSCCGSSCNGTRSYQTTANPCGTCCKSTTLNCGTAGTLMCTQGTGSRYCSPGTCGTGSVLIGTSATGYSCSTKSKPNNNCTWVTNSWQCSACYRDGSVYNSSSACIYNGPDCTPGCTASRERFYSCSMKYIGSVGNPKCSGRALNEWTLWKNGTLLCSHTNYVGCSFTYNCPFMTQSSLSMLMAVPKCLATGGYFNNAKWISNSISADGYGYFKAPNCTADCNDYVSNYDTYYTVHSCSTSKWTY